MSHEAPASVKKLFDQAIEISDASQREKFLHTSCGNDSALLSELRALLAAAERAEDLFATHNDDSTEIAEISPATAPLIEGPGTIVGRYKLLQKIGEGGFGVVYMAEQKTPVKRRVALKIIKLGMDTKQVVARFEAERQALALMDHPNIAKVLDGGATDTGRPYFVMELVKGLPITEFCDQNQLTSEARLNLFTATCQAIQHAHQKGVIHRDIKPTNVLVSVYDDEPVVKVIDFGIAKATQHELTEKTLFTQFQQLIGSPAYMSPEQAQWGGRDVDTRSDVYSLGVLLYELLTGSTPFDAKELAEAGYQEMQRRIREDEPIKPSTKLGTIGVASQSSLAKHRATAPEQLTSFVKGDLDWIVMKALEKDRTHRYETANELGRDVQRFLKFQPITASPPSQLYRLQKLVRRHKWPLAIAASIALLLTTASVVSGWMAIRAMRAEGVAYSEAQRAQASEAAEARQRRIAESNEAQAEARLIDARHEQGKVLIERANTLKEQHRYFEANLVAAQALGFEGYGARNLSQDDIKAYPRLLKPDSEDSNEAELFIRSQPDYAPVFSSGYSRHHDWTEIELITFTDDNHLVSYGSGRWGAAPGTIRFWNLSSGNLVKEIGGGNAMSADTKLMLKFSPGQHILENLRDPRSKVELAGAGGNLRSATFSRDGRVVAVYHKENNATDIYDTDTGLLRSTISMPAFNWTDRRSLSLNATGNVCATHSGTNQVHLWNTLTGVQTKILEGHETPVTVTLFHPSEPIIISGAEDGSVRMWSINEGIATHVLEGPKASVTTLCLHPNRPELFVAYDDHTIRIWDLDEQRIKESVPNHFQSSTALAISSEGEQLAAGSADGWIGLWSLNPLKSLNPSPAHTRNPNSVAISPDGSTLASAADDHTVRLWNIAEARTTAILTGHKTVVHSVAWSPDGLQLASLDENAEAIIWNPATGEAQHRLAPGKPTQDGFRWLRARTIAFSPNGQHLVTRKDRTPILWDLNNLDQRQELEKMSGPITCVAFDASGRHLAVSDSHGTARIYDLEDETHISVLEPEDPSIFKLISCLVFSPVSSHLLVAGNRGSIRVWDMQDEGFISTFGAGQQDHHYDMTISPDGGLLATAGGDYTVRLWDWNTGTERAILRAHEGQVVSVAFGPDGSFLVSCSLDGSLMVWDLEYDQPDVLWKNDNDHITNLITDEKREAIYATYESGALERRNIVDGTLISRYENAFDRKMTHVIGGLEPGQLFAAHQSGKIVEWFADSKGIDRQFQPSDSAIKCLSLNQRHGLLASAGKEITVTDLETGNLLASWDAENLGELVAWDPDGKQLATANNSTTVAIWNLETGTLSNRFHFPGESVSSLAYTPDGSHLAVGGYNLIILDPETGTIRFRTNSSPSDYFLDLVPSPDSRSLALTRWTSNHGITGALEIEVIDLASFLPQQHLDIVPNWSPSASLNTFKSYRSDGHSLTVGAQLSQSGRRSQSSVVWRLDLADRTTKQEPLGKRLEYFQIQDSKLEWKTPLASTNLFHVAHALSLPTATQPPFLQRLHGPGSTPRKTLKARFLSCLTARNWSAAEIVARQLNNNFGLTTPITDFSKSINQNIKQLLQNDNPKLAGWYLKRFADIGREQASYWTLRSQFARQSDDLNQVVEFLSKATQLPGATKDTHRDLALALESQNHLSEAKAVMETAQQMLNRSTLQEDEYRIYTLDYARLQAENGLLEEAVALVTQTLDIPPRSKDTKFPVTPLDLTPFYNHSIFHPWPDSPFNTGTLKALAPLGLKNWKDVPFDVRGIIALDGGHIQPPYRRGDRWPESVKGIPVGRKGKFLHVVHAVRWSGHRNENRSMLQYMLHYQDGTSHQIHANLGRDLRDWFSNDNIEPELEIAWRGYTGTYNAQLFKSSWPNPHPERIIQSIDLESSMNEPVPFVVAITVE